jgi:carbon-monoxide dehydrogenase small subunit
MTSRVVFTLNGRDRSIDVDDAELLCDSLRRRFDLTGTKVGCREGVCGSCDVLLDTDVVRSCLVLTAQVDGRSVRTVEGLGQGRSIGALQEAFVRHGAVQCGFCTPGLLIAATAALEGGAPIAAEDFAEVLSGNLCRCTGYAKILDAVREVALGPGEA